MERPLLIQVGSYQRALELLDIPHAKLIVDLVVLVAVASCLNSAIYTSSRMVFSLAKRGDAPSVLKLTNTAHVPRPAVLASTAVGFLTTIVNYFAPEKVFTFLLASSGAVALLVYLVIAVAQLRMRKQLQVSGQPIEFRMWLYPLADLGGDPVHRRRAEHHADHAGAPSRGVRHRSADDLHRLPRLLNARRKPRLGEDYAGKTARV